MRAARAGMRRIFSLVGPVALLLSSSVAGAQSTTERSFRAQSDESGAVADCSLRAIDSASSVSDQRSFLVRPQRQDVVVSQLVGGGLTGAQADTQLDGTSSLLQVDDTDAVATDVGCCVELRRTGAVANIGTTTAAGVTVTCGGTTVTVAGGVVTTNAQLNTIECASGDQAGDIIVVNGLQACGTATGNFNGCAQNGQAMVVAAGVAFATWAHEFGHVQGLGHNPACVDNAGNSTCGTAPCTCGSATAANQRNIMFCQGCAGRNTINANECSSYRTNADS